MPLAGELLNPVPIVFPPPGLNVLTAEAAEEEPLVPSAEVVALAFPGVMSEGLCTVAGIAGDTPVEFTGPPGKVGVPTELGNVDDTVPLAPTLLALVEEVVLSEGTVLDGWLT